MVAAGDVAGGGAVQGGAGGTGHSVQLAGGSGGGEGGDGVQPSSIPTQQLHHGQPHGQPHASTHHHDNNVHMHDAVQPPTQQPTHPSPLHQLGGKEQQLGDKERQLVVQLVHAWTPNGHPDTTAATTTTPLHIPPQGAPPAGWVLLCRLVQELGRRFPPGTPTNMPQLHTFFAVLHSAAGGAPALRGVVQGVLDAHAGGGVEVALRMLQQLVGDMQ